MLEIEDIGEDEIANLRLEVATKYVLNQSGLLGTRIHSLFASMLNKTNWLHRVNCKPTSI